MCYIERQRVPIPSTKTYDHRECPIAHLVFEVSIKSNKRTHREQSITITEYSPEEVSEKTRKIYSKIIETSEHIKKGNFTHVSIEDLEVLFDLYDGAFFSGQLRKLIDLQKNTQLVFTLSKRMTQAGGKIKLSREIIKTDEEIQEEVIYEIRIATTLLFQTFQDVKRTITINGIVCNDRLEALQRIFEHELIHLLEFIVWKKSSCSATNFKNLTRQIFAHTETIHHLVTQTECALKKYGIKIGDIVEFMFRNTAYTGIVNRITKRATVLVEHPDGRLYSDNKQYLKFYIPLSKLKKIVEPTKE